MRGSSSLKGFAAALGCVALAFVLAAILPSYYLYLGNLLMMYAILALGLDILLGWSGQFAFAHIAFFGIGIYGTALLQSRLGVPFVIGMPAAAALAAFIGFLVALPSTRLHTVYLALATYAFAECVQWVFRSWDWLTRGPDGLRIGAPSLFGWVTASDRRAFPVMAILLALVVAATLSFARSELARRFCAIRDSEPVAAASGIDVRRAKLAAFTLSAFYAGVAGGTYTLFQSFIHPDELGLSQLVLVLSMIVVGGSGSLPGVLIGVVLIGLLPQVLSAAPAGLLIWQEFAYGVILMGTIMFMPRGVWGVLRGAGSRRRAALAPGRPPRAASLERQTR